MEIQQKTPNKQRYSLIKSSESQPLSTQKSTNIHRKSPPKIQFRKPNYKIGTMEYQQIKNDNKNDEQQNEQMEGLKNERRVSQVKSRPQSKANSYNSSRISIHTHTIGINSQYNGLIVANPNSNIQLQNRNNEAYENQNANNNDNSRHEYKNNDARSINKDSAKQYKIFGMIKKNKININIANAVANEQQKRSNKNNEEFNTFQNNNENEQEPKMSQNNNNHSNANINRSKFGVIAHILPSEQYSIANNSQVESKQIYDEDDKGEKQFIRSRPIIKNNSKINADKINDRKHQKQLKINKELQQIYDPSYKDQLLLRPRNTSPFVGGGSNKKINYNSGDKKNIINKQVLIDNYGQESQATIKSKHSQSQLFQSSVKQLSNNKIYRCNNVNKIKQNKKVQQEIQRANLAKYYNNQSEEHLNSFIHQIQSDYHSIENMKSKIREKGSIGHQYSEAKQQKLSSQQIDLHAQNSFSPTNKLFHKNKANHNEKNNRATYGPGGIQTLQFNPQKEKLIVLQSKQTERNVHLDQFVEDFEIPIPQPIPTLQNTPQQLIEIAKANFIKFGCLINDQTLINVKKYKNCVHFNISNEQNILWHYDTGKFYFGAWKMLANGEGEKSGDGIQYMPLKYKFKGHFVSGKRSGYGILINFDGSAYVGQWQFGLKHGEGRQLTTQGIIYEGQWKQGKRNGFGRLINNERLQFQGIFEKGLKNGHGKQYFENGDFYDGNYVDHKFEGNGTYYWKSGAVYSGEFKQGKRDGYGVWRSSGEKCDIYEGFYKQDKKDGKGIYKWPNGAIYEGFFVNDLKHGQGIITYQNGAVANLVWKKGQVEKKNQQLQINDEEQKSLLSKIASQRKFSRENFKNNAKSSNKYNKIMERNKPNSRSTQNLQSSRSSTNSANNFTNPIMFNVNKSKKSLSNLDKKYGFNFNKGNKMIKFRVQNVKDQNNFEIGINRNTFQRKNESNKKIKKVNSLPKEKPYQGIQTSANINLN